jgi:hypothetical protein
LFCLASRLFNIFPLSLMINIYQRKNPKRQIPLKEQFVMWFAGTLRFPLQVGSVCLFARGCPPPPGALIKAHTCVVVFYD